MFLSIFQWLISEQLSILSQLNDCHSLSVNKSKIVLPGDYEILLWFFIINIKPLHLEILLKYDIPVKNKSPAGTDQNNLTLATCFHSGQLEIQRKS